MDTCLFCKILRKEIPNHTVYEDEFVLAFLDIFPCAKGHTVVIPKIHVEVFAEMNEDVTQKFFVGVKNAFSRIEKVLVPQGCNIGWNDGKAAGQAVPHLHVHILPRWENDGGGSMHSIIKNPGEMKIEEVAKLFKL